MLPELNDLTMLLNVRSNMSDFVTAENQSCCVFNMHRCNFACACNIMQFTGTNGQWTQQLLGPSPCNFLPLR